ncbi:MAG TPA: DEAD/DEAH box helicase [Actinocrinis sp.]|nr:DEAD/DEAH box helicase [Actinocrinis sp.]HEV2342815.1 DEAD/DEAH box helicase [Actinocrinis sp.]
MNQSDKIQTDTANQPASVDETANEPGAPVGDEVQPAIQAEELASRTADAGPNESAGTFAELGVLAETVEALDTLGITSPFPIQAATIPVALSGADVIGQAKTGTGKTLAFGIPVLQRVAGPGRDPGTDEDAAADTAAAALSAPSRRSSRRRRTRTPSAVTGQTPAHGTPQALVVVPTRELAIQVTNDLLSAGKVRAVRVHALYGGRAYEPQIAALRAGIDIAVGTPGRLLDLARQHHLELGSVRTLVLDEADEMLDLGFLPDVERIMAQLPAERQTMLFSATMPGQVISLARRYMNRPTHIRAADPADPGTTVKAIEQFVFRAHSLDKVEMLSRILQAEGRGLTMIFARTKRTVAKIAEELSDRHFAVAAVHGDLGQGAREQALRAFRNGKIDVLVATDVAARGIDVEGVTHVVNFQCPEDEKVYTHRIGRTGRAGNKGTAVTFVDWDEVPRWQLINKALSLPFAEPPELYSTSPQLYADLGIPEGVKGVLPRQERVREGLDAEEIEDLGETGRGRGARSSVKRGAKDGGKDKDTTAKQERARAPRQRTRTRRGVKIAAEDGALDTAGGTTDTAAAVNAAPAAVAKAVAVAEPVAEKAPRKRTRTRKSAAKTAAPKIEYVAEAPAAATATATGEAAAVSNNDGDGDVNAGAVANPKRTRVRSTRTRKSAPAKPVVENTTDTPSPDQ